VLVNIEVRHFCRRSESRITGAKDAIQYQVSVVAFEPVGKFWRAISMGSENLMSSRGNPNWGQPYTPIPFLRTEFEQQVEKLGLSPHEYQASPQLRNWCRKNAHLHYVPEYLLKFWGMRISENWGPTMEYMVVTRRN
jgi:hypothetical protein